MATAFEPDVTRLHQHLESVLPAGLDLLRQMVAINSFTANREGVNRLGRLTAEAFAPLGFTAEFVPSTHSAWGDHLVLSRPGAEGGPSLAMIAHLDTVFPPEEEARNDFRWRREGDRIYGPGTHDIKGGTVMMWLVLEALRAWAPAAFEAVTWRLFWNSSEEAFASDFGEVCRQRLAPGTRAALVFEAEGREDGQADRPLLVVARKGRAAWRIRVSGRGAHAGARHPHGANAIVQLALLLPRVAMFTDYARGLTFNVGTIAGGTVLNRVPHEAVAEVEFRAFDTPTFVEASVRLQALAGPGEVVSPEDQFPCQVSVDLLSETRPWPRNEGSEWLFEVWRAAGTALQLRPGTQHRGGLSDGNLLWDAVPTLDGLGPWGENDHCSERSDDGSKVPEYVAVSSFVPKAMWNCLAIARLVAEPEGGAPAEVNAEASP